MGLTAPSTRTMVVVTGGDPVDLATVPGIAEAACTIAADSGIELAQALGLFIDLAVGDFDSVDPAALDAAIRAGADVERHPADKDATDLELGLDAAIVRGATRIVVLGGHGGRLDHLLANVAALSAPAYADVDVVAHVGPATITVIRHRATLTGSPGELVSLLPQHGPAQGVTTTGLRFPLADEPLSPGSTRGISNVFEADRATVTLRSGVLAAVQPHHRQSRPPAQE